MPAERAGGDPAGAQRPVPRAAIEAVVRQIAARFDPVRVILFGAYARGESRPGSDVDLLVIMDTDLKEVGQAAAICRGVEYRFGLDLLVRTPATPARRPAQGDFFLREVIEQGEVLHARPAT